MHSPNQKTPSRICRLAAIPLALALLAAAPMTAPAQTVPPTLGTGGPFVAETLFEPFAQVSGDCDPDGTSVLSYTTSGEAFGPYPGTYMESGTATVGPQAPGAVGFGGFVLTFDATFTIDSPVGQVSGTKTLAVPQSEFLGGTCQFTTFFIRRIVIPNFSATYDALIVTPTGETFRDRGATDVQIADPGSFQEVFQSELFEVVPVASGDVTGGGWIVTPTGQVSFGFNALKDSQGVKGNCEVVDHATNTQIKCLTVNALVVTGTHATFSGQATVDGVTTNYRIDVDDLSEPGPGDDTFKIQTDSGYLASGILQGGNIQIHQ